MFVKGKDLWSHIDGPTIWEGNDAGEVKTARVVTWIHSFVKPHIMLSLRPYKTAKDIEEYLKKVYN